MKKTFLILLTSAFMLSFTACGDKNKKTDEVAPAETTGTEVSAPQEEATPPAVKTPEETLKDFEAYVKAYAEANNNKLKDIQKYQTLAMQSQQQVADMERIKSNFDAKQLKRYEKAVKLIGEINNVKK